MKLFSLLTLLCATSVHAGYYQCHCSGLSTATSQEATNKACNKMRKTGAQLIRYGNGYDCKLSYSHPNVQQFERVSNNTYPL
ncbi:hypothetical protein LZ32DRAFT_103234 [Colletotrichum eremochloae]|nr:hypothetical protein LZ32DRAFT_103234 [Colletotrichum eremochloae]